LQLRAAAPADGSPAFTAHDGGPGLG